MHFPCHKGSGWEDFGIFAPFFITAHFSLAYQQVEIMCDMSHTDACHYAVQLLLVDKKTVQKPVSRSFHVPQLLSNNLKIPCLM